MAEKAREGALKSGPVRVAEVEKRFRPHKVTNLRKKKKEKKDERKIELSLLWKFCSGSERETEMTGKRSYRPRGWRSTGRYLPRAFCCTKLCLPRRQVGWLKKGNRLCCCSQGRPIQGWIGSKLVGLVFISWNLELAHLVLESELD